MVALRVDGYRGATGRPPAGQRRRRQPHAGRPATLIAANPFPLAALGGVGGGFIRSQPGKTGRVSLTATHATLGQASVGLTVT